MEDNGFIIDLSDAHKTSEIIYELSKILDIPEAQNKQISLKLGDVDLTQTELISVKALVESMDSTIKLINTNSVITKDAAKSLEIKISEEEQTVEAPDFEMESSVSPEVETALDKIFGDGDSQAVQEVAKKEPEAVVEIEEEPDEETLELIAEAETLPTVYIKNTVRSGQSIKADGNLLVIGDVNAGAEVVAKGDITVWGILAGIAHAGCEGNHQAKIRALKLNAIQLRIANIYARRPDGVNTPFVQKTNEFVPEEAKAYKKNIIINKILED